MVESQLQSMKLNGTPPRFLHLLVLTMEESHREAI